MAKGTGCPSLVLANCKSVAVGFWRKGTREARDESGRKVGKGQDINRAEKKNSKRNNKREWERKIPKYD